MKPIRLKNLITQYFSIDHERLDFLFRMYRFYKQQDRYKAALLFDKFRSDLLRHIEWEEELLIPAFERASQIEVLGVTETIRREHQQIKTLLSLISDQLPFTRAC